MSWTRFLFRDFWRACEFDRLEGRMRRTHQADRRSRVELRDRVKELESDLGRVALLARALLDACVAKGVLARDEIAAMIAKADLADGVPDGKLDPKRLR